MLNLFGKLNNNLSNIIYINIAVFVLINIYYTIIFLMQVDNTIISYLGLSSNFKLLLKYPWTIFTYMFVHEDLLHVIINLCWLYFGGKIFISYLDSKDLLATYIMGGLSGAIIYIISFNIFPAFELIKFNSLAIGASASVLSILFSAATQTPNFPISIFSIKSIKLKHIAVIAIIIDLLSITQANPGGHIAHIGGAIYGFCYISVKKYGINLNYPIQSIIDLLLKEKRKFTYSKKENDYEYNARKQYEQKKIDSILDKISKSGYDSLSQEEKDELFNQ